MLTHNCEFKELSQALVGGAALDFERRLSSFLKGPLFDSLQGQTAEQASRLSYQRFVALNRFLNFSPEDIATVSKRFLIAHELVALVDGTLATLMTIHFNLCIGTILEHGSEELHGNLIQELFALESVGVFLATELGYGSNIVSLKTEATLDIKNGDFVLHTPHAEAQKFMPNTGASGVAKLAIVMARLKVKGEDHGVFPFVVRIRDKNGELPGIRVTRLGEKPGYALDNAVTSFENVRVPFHHILLGRHCTLDREGNFRSGLKSHRGRFLQSMDRVQTGKLCLSSAATRGSQAALQITLRYATQRKTFAPKRPDVPILEYQNQQKALFSALARTVACTLMYQKAQMLLREKGKEAEVNRYLALTKVVCTYEAQKTFLVCREKLGSQGLFSENRIIDYLNHVQGAITAEGDNEILLIKVAREMLMGECRRGLRLFRSYNLTSLAGQQSLLLERERRMLKRLKWKMGVLRKKGLFESWNENINDAIEMAESHGMRLAHENLCEQVKKIECKEERRALERLALLFGLELISSPWFVANRLISRRQWKSLSAERQKIYPQVNAEQERWISSFQISDDILRSPLLKGDYIAAYNFLEKPSASVAL